MNSLLILIGLVIISCVLLNNASFRVGLPVFLLFIFLGVLIGNQTLFPLVIDPNDKEKVGQICSAALIFVMFYGGFGTSWSSARPIVLEASLLASVGVFITAALTGFFCHFILKWGWVESMLLGSVVSSTDAASVFSTLRTHKMGLKNRTAPILEMESGSNDPCSYMLTILMISMLQCKGESLSALNIIVILCEQIGIGAIFGIIISICGAVAMKKIHFETSGFNSLFLTALAIISYALPTVCHGNGYLSAYLVGLVLGNQSFPNKRQIVHFFDGVTSLMQVVIFFLLGTLMHFSDHGKCILVAILIFFFLLLIARPFSIFCVLFPFKKYKFRQRLLISFCGLRGASSIVFAILAVVGNEKLLENDIFNIVFVIVIISIGCQGYFIPKVAAKLDMLDENDDVMKTFSDFSDEMDLVFSEIKITSASPWNNKAIKDIGLPKELLFCMVIKANGTKLIPNGRTFLEEGDTIVVCSKEFASSQKIRIIRHTLSENSRFSGKQLRELPYTKSQILMIQRGRESIIPHGSTVMEGGDIIYINKCD